jgi:hypothetical protein
VPPARKALLDGLPRIADNSTNFGTPTYRVIGLRGGGWRMYRSCGGNCRPVAQCHRAFGAQARDARMLCSSYAKKLISVIGFRGREIRMDIDGKTHGA